MSKQQTAVEWLIEKLSQNLDGIYLNRHFGHQFKQAKAMERQQIKDTYNAAFNNGVSVEFTAMAQTAEQYYTETFGDESPQS